MQVSCENLSHGLRLFSSSPCVMMISHTAPACLLLDPDECRPFHGYDSALCLTAHCSLKCRRSCHASRKRFPLFLSLSGAAAASCSPSSISQELLFSWEHYVFITAINVLQSLIWQPCSFSKELRAACITFSSIQKEIS